MENIEELASSTILGYYKEAVMDSNYNPTSENYNQSGFTLDELETEILNRMNFVNEIEPEIGDWE